MLSKRFSMLMAASAVLLCSSSAFATVLDPGNTVTPSNFTGALAAGNIIASSSVAGTAGTVSGTYNLAVYQESGVDKYLYFLYQFITDSSSDAIRTLTMNSFALNLPGAGLGQIDVGYLTSDTTDLGDGTQIDTAFATPGTTSGTITPVNSDRNPGSGNVIGFNWVANPTDNRFKGTSDILVIKTQAKLYIPGFASAIDGGTLTVNAYAPAPEPGTFGLLSGVVGLGLYLARRRRGLQS